MPQRIQNQNSETATEIYRREVRDLQSQEQQKRDLKALLRGKYKDLDDLYSKVSHDDIEINARK